MDGTFAALLLFSFVSSVTPGPNNLMLLASGVNFGFRRTIPHMMGIGVGFMLMTAVIGLGLGRIFIAVPLAYTVLKYAGAAYLLWLAWKIANSGPVGESKAGGVPMTFLQAALFQWVNPKAWMMAVTAVATYTLSENLMTNTLIVALAFGIVNLPCVSVWAAFGVAMQGFLGDPLRLRMFNWLMAGLLVASLWPIFAEVLP